MARMMTLLDMEDPVLHEHLVDELDIEPCLFAIKWFRTLFTQTFLLPDLLRLWDTLFSVKDLYRVEYFVCITVAFILIANNDDQLLKSDQMRALQILQVTVGEVPDVNLLASLAYAIFIKHHPHYPLRYTLR
jgi:hypothetical protein